ncbi:An1-type Zinc finger protein 1-like [Plakobranchus ocellatus]|uniref:An1-type Zinc finger protein 1-like n=1 Tax=Plakobranchus ocellatus TaxID=259542 RepID=A0AAV3ZEJ0_9GAST|nr:An1-type Zinc finger protein 1-like [Plakobranchus ocellatus]
MELPHIGQNCDAENCNQLDFLPFKCDHCGKVFCLQHKFCDDHKCTAPAREQNEEYQGERSYSCTIPGCEKKELTPIVCHHCNLNFCLSHRTQEDHNCEKLPGRARELTKTAEHVEKILAQKEFKPKATPTNPKAIQMAAKIALMKLKTKATGDVGIPQAERVYFNILLPIESKKPPIPLFVSKMWSIGRLIDFVADKASITNRNNTGAVKKLAMFHGDTGIRLPPDSSINGLLEDSAVMLLNGSTVILECVHDSVDVLDNIKLYKR